MIIGKITEFNGQIITIKAPFSDAWLLEKQAANYAEISILDGRKISVEQRKKAYALIRDIANWTGYLPEEAKEVMKYDFIVATGNDYFSLANCDMTTARLFISHLIEFCIVHNIPCADSLLAYAEDIGKYLYLCLMHKKCCICGKKAHIHHVDRIGMGANRNEVCHIGYEAMALCVKHHEEAHAMSKQAFNEKYHVFGIKLDGALCKALKLGKFKEV